ncbi:hypothetical protein BDV96DRAFT_507425 [Lophiotrema nucula]|uniref:Cora-like Mg2+ transporter protein-domain-containing protein n=1 Tax=Lophiotrema nucula TaxID=690887 RepID=A0A6A5YKI4_9PLEO|nr:hypothetical protein BDV96DRAFT_507425 [Lophiotrema nucula]
MIRNPCLTDLHEFLRRPGPAIDRSRIVSLDFLAGDPVSTAREVQTADLQAEWDIEGGSSITAWSDLKRLGQVLIIEEISKELIEDLGSRFDIDPWFFASYIRRAWRNTNTQNTATCTLPSRERNQDFLPLYYHRTLSFESIGAELVQLRRKSQHERKVFVMPKMAGERIGLAQHFCSILLIQCGSHGWKSLILADPSMDDEYLPGKRNSPLPPVIPSKLFLGGCEDFSSGREPGSNSLRSPRPTNRGMLEELVYYWSLEAPPMFNPNQPTLQSIAYYPLKIVAAEWVNYVAVMGLTMKDFELSTKTSSDLSADLTKLNSNLRGLQAWRRRVLSTQGKLQQVNRFIKRQHKLHGQHDDWEALLEDYEHIGAEVEEHGHRLEAMIPVVTSAVQLVESRRSLIETANVTRLTVLALIFIPLTYIASIFSMSDQFGPSGSEFWVYFTVAVPVTLIVILIAKPPTRLASYVANITRGFKEH